MPFPVLKDRGIAPNLWIPIADVLIDVIAEALLALTTGDDALPNFHVVDARNTLTPASVQDCGNSADWLNGNPPGN